MAIDCLIYLYLVKAVLCAGDPLHILFRTLLCIFHLTTEFRCIFFDLL